MGLWALLGGALGQISDATAGSLSGEPVWRLPSLNVPVPVEALIGGAAGPVHRLPAAPLHRCGDDVPAGGSATARRAWGRARPIRARPI